jgi:hypothetical protein
VSGAQGGTWALIAQAEVDDGQCAAGALRGLLLEHTRADRYPQRDMNMLEQIASPRVLVEYTLHLMERIEGDTYR